MKIDAKTQLFGEIGGLAAKIIDRTASPEKAKDCLLYTSPSPRD